MMFTFYLSPPLRTWRVSLPDTATEADVWREWYAQTADVFGYGGWE